MSQHDAGSTSCSSRCAGPRENRCFVDYHAETFARDPGIAPPAA